MRNHIGEKLTLQEMANRIFPTTVEQLKERLDIATKEGLFWKRKYEETLALLHVAQGYKS